MDLLRSCYEVNMKMFTDSETLIHVRWYFTDKPPLPFPTVFNSRNWLYDKKSTYPLGESASGYRPWVTGASPPWQDAALPCDCWKDQRRAVSGASIGDKLCLSPIWCEVQEEAVGLDAEGIADNAIASDYPLFFTEALVPAVARQAAFPPTANWSNIGRSRIEDGLVATWSIFGLSKFIIWEDFGASVPDPDATIRGVEVSIKRAAIAGDRHDNLLWLHTDASPFSGDRAKPDDWPPDLTWESYGGPTDLWDTTLDPATVNYAGFGVTIQTATNNGGVAAVDACKMVIYYTL